MRIEESLSREFGPRLFGRKGVAVAAAIAPRSTLANDLKLFALTFAGGFLFVSILIG